MSDLENNLHSDEEGNDPRAHKRLLHGVDLLGRTQYIKKVTRTEPAALIQDELHLSKASGESAERKRYTVNTGDIIKSLKKTSGNIKVAKDLKNKTKKNLNTPLEKTVADRIQRTIGYEKIKKNLSRWEAVVQRNRASDHQIFPLDFGETHIIDTTNFKRSENSKIKSDLMIEMEAVDAKLRSLKNIQTTEEELDEKKLKQKLTRAELIERRKELAYLRVRQSQKSAKARMQNKIKSKKFHKLLKREKFKQEMKEFELLQKSNPEAALEKLEQIEKNRVMERANLRHKNTGTWAKNLQVRAKYDKDVRKDLAEQLAISRELTAKRKDVEDDESESEKDEVNENEKPDFDPFNPWIRKTKKKEPATENEVQKYMSNYKQYWLERNENEKKLHEYKKDIGIENNNGDISDIEEEDKQHSSEEKFVNKHSEDSDEDFESDYLDSDTDDILKFKNSIKTSNGTGLKKNNKIVKKSQSNKRKLDANSWQVEDCTPSMLQLGPLKIADRLPGKKVKNNSNKFTNIDDLFDEAEDILQDKISKKVKALTSSKSNIEKVKQRKNKNKTKGQKNAHLDLSFKTPAKHAVFDEELIETPANVSATEQILSTIQDDTEAKVITKESSTRSEMDSIDPNKFANIKPKILHASLPDNVNEQNFFESEDEEAIDHKKMTIAEAFEDDDILADFEKEREDEQNKNNDIDLTLPGWGSWGGPGIFPKKKIKRHILKFPTETRKDENKGNVYIRQEPNEKLKKCQVSQVPFPFKSVKDYEDSIRGPIGRSFVPETAFRVLTKPEIVTKMGHIIEPMKEDVLLKKQRKPRHVVDKRIAMLNK